MIGISCPNFSLHPFDAILESVRKDFGLWEIVAELEHDLLSIEEDISYAIESYGMKFNAHGPIADMNIGSPSERLRKSSMEELLRILDSCQRLRIGCLTLHPGSAIAYGEDVKSRVHDATRRSIEEIDDWIQGTDLRVALENMPPASWSICNDAEELLSIIAGTKIGICFDIGHAHIAGSTESFLEDHVPLINLHLHNNHGVSDEHLPLDSGNIDIEYILDALKRRYDGDYIIESRSLEEGLMSLEILREML